MIVAGQRPVGGRCRVPERNRDERPAGAGAVDAVADDRRPLHVHRCIGRQALRRESDLRVDGARGGGELCARRRGGAECGELERRLRVERRGDVRRPVDLRLRTAVVLRHREGELLAGAPRDRRLLDVEVLEADRVGDLDRVLADRPGGADVRHGGAARPVRHHRADVVVVVQERRAALVQRRTEPVVRDRDHRADRAPLRADRRRAGDQEAAVGDLDAVDHGVDVVDAAEVLWRRQLHGQVPLRVGLRLGEDDLDLRGRAAEVVDAVGPGVDDPRHVGRAPDDRDGLARGQSAAGEGERRPGDRVVGLRRQGLHGRGRRRGGRERAGQCCDARERRDDEGRGRGGCERWQEQGSCQRRKGRNWLEWMLMVATPSPSATTG